jgi:MFS family permease
MERLRDRTDELELIISSLTIFALFSLPGWLMGRISEVFTHLSTSLVVASSLGVTIVAGVSYGLAACFVVHLMARAYWVGLIGLRTVFPEGINWDKTPGMGPLSRRYYRDLLPDLDTVIQKTDRLASSLFAVISMLTLSFLWLGTILMFVLVASAAIGARYGQTNAALGFATVGLAIVFAGIPLLVYLLDAQLASRLPQLQDSKLFTGLVRFLKRIAGMALPQRLVLPVQLTLQSNTRPIAFFIGLTVSIAAIVLIGNYRVAAWQTFTVSGAFTYLDSVDVQDGLRSVYYEDMPSDLDRLRGWPRVDSFHQDGSFARLFLPYQPLRDNLILEKACGRVDQTEQRVGCLRQLWSVSIEGEAVSMDAFIPAERADLGMRGLVGLVPLDALEPGLKRITVTWNPDGADDTVPVDDRYTQITSTYDIPIAFSPAFERALD